MKFQVELHALCADGQRTVEVPEAELLRCNSRADRLELIWYYGQNDHQPQQCRSICVGDVIQYNSQRWEIDSFGFVPPREGGEA